MKTFEELGIAPEILKAIQELGFESPMPIQEKVIPILLKEENDIVALAQTGTGKTAAFGLPLIQKIDTESKHTQALILCPTRELCLQITGDLNDFAKYTTGLKVLAVYGGASIETQINAAKKGVHIIVATPGRLIDLMNRKAVKLNAVNKVVLDEADEMLTMGFSDSINAILAGIPEDRNTLLFSATMPDQIAAISRKYMNSPVEITVGHKNTGSENVKHIYYTVHAKDKYLALKRIADFNPNIYGIVFCRTRRETQEIAEKLIKDGYNADALHGDLSQAQRDSVMQKFRIRYISLLVATDVAARGLDVDDLTHVINFSLPDEIESYTHRSGRTGRAGKSGISIAIINLKEKYLIRQIEKKIGKQFSEAQIPSGREICEKQLFTMVDKMEKVEVDHSQIDTYLPVIYKKLEWLDKEELIKKFVSLEFNRFLEYYRDAVDLSAPDERSRDDRGSSRRDSGEGRRGRTPKTPEGYTRMFINVGKLDGLYPNDLIALINEHTPGSSIKPLKVDLMKSFSFFEVEDRDAQKIVEAFQSVRLKNNRVSVEIAQQKDSDTKKDSSERGSRERSSGGRERSGGFRGERSGGSRERSGGGRERSGGGEKSGGSRDRSGGGKDRPNNKSNKRFR